MNFRTSHLAGLLASALLVLSSTSGLLSAAEPLNITGPDGESRQTLRQYGPTTASDTFWSIAQKTRPDASVTIYQVMAAIYEANPHAFTSDNYNSLEKGMILLIPSKEVMLAIPKSLAKQQAESNDKGWRQKPQTAAKPKPVTTTTKQAQASEASQPELVQTDKPSAEQQKQIEALTAKLEAEQAKNLSLTDELARAQDKLNLGNNDSEMLQAKIDEQSSRIAELEEALLVQKEQKAQLNSEVEQLRQQLAAATQPAKPKEVDDSWRTMMDNPLYLGLFAAIPALLLLVLVWLFIKRRNNKSEAVESSAPVTPPMDDKPVAPAPEDSEEMMAVHLDTDDEADSLDSLMKVDETQLKPEADLSDELPQEAAEMVVDAGDEQVMSPIEDEGQSLDDLWAEAMGEQEQEEAKTTQEDDLDSLLAELDAPQEAPIEETHVEEKSLEETAFEAPTFEEEATTETDLDELLAEFEQETPSEDAKEEDLDALLAEFDLPAETVTEETSVEEETRAEETSLEEIKPEEAAEPEATAASEETLADEIAQELEEAFEAKGDEGDVDETDLDALLAGFDAEPAAQASDSEDDEIARQIAAELEEENDEVEEADLDALLAEFEPAAPTSEPEAEVADLEFAEDEAEETAPEETAPELDVAAELAAEQEAGSQQDSQQESKPAGHAPLEFDLGEDKPAAEAEAEEEIKAEDDGEVDLDALLADLESVEEAEEPKVEKGESGFFGDLKGNKRSSDNMLEWESALTSDAPSAQETPVEDDDDAISLQLDDDDNLTVDQALAALDAAEKKRPARAVPEHDLTAFQQDNGFIDIDRLLNEADEEQLDVDKYKELDVDMGELDSLMGNAAMVDVDDEENAVNAKLDLARAYIEIDDMDSAKALLKEVELDGNERQQQEAKKLLDEL
ncbi:hypothetical protein K0J45_11770 [Shewanella alkalitolerans]|uniref:FimV/HubP family polar landmark protein n=1 Tax=Shewanella alkalitolerans TaxID=2864209 RepID=UPI001C65B567|nr:FimV/HubP family polar landmark protein [Shewanella alkalitolerans]QYJ96236.1 hypothetical protein K0J45_11770 [Shewanella alkalitolerans]